MTSRRAADGAAESAPARPRRLWIAAASLAVLGGAAAVWWRWGRPDAGPRPPDALAPRQPGPDRHAPRPGAAAHDRVAISGTVIDRLDGTPVGGVQVVLRGSGGEHVTTASGDGGYTLEVPPGEYRAFVRDDRVLTVGIEDRFRIATDARAEIAGALDEDLLPRVTARADIPSLDLGVVSAAHLSGMVVDGDGLPVAHATVRTLPADPAHPVGARSVLGTDVAVTDAQGRFDLRVPPGRYVVDASHPRYAGVSGGPRIDLAAGGHASTTVLMVRGCVISGRVVRPDGAPANDGALELADASTIGFAPGGRIDLDGTFRWTTTEEADVMLRAWPWMAAPSEARPFPCRDGARFDDVVFHLPEGRPDLAGVIVDGSGAPVPLAFLDIKALDSGGISQQERADAGGRWQVYALQPGRYEIAATAPGRGVAVATIASPRDDVRIQLGGTGRIAGTVPGLATGSLEVRFESCSDILDAAQQPLAVPHEPQLVPVVGGRFAIDGAPACQLAMVARWRGTERELDAVVPAGGTARVEVPLGPPHPKIVRGTVRDASGAPAANVRVTAALDRQPATTVRTDGAGRFRVETYSGAVLVAGDGTREANATVGAANIPTERVDLVLSKR